MARFGCGTTLLVLLVVHLVLTYLLHVPSDFFSWLLAGVVTILIMSFLGGRRSPSTKGIRDLMNYSWQRGDRRSAVMFATASWS